MQRSTDRILTTHAGSMIRPPEVLAVSADGIDEQTRSHTLRGAVDTVVHKQVECGIDVVSDGEFGKSSWFTYVMSRLDGYEVRPADRPRITHRGRDEERFADFWSLQNIGQPHRRHVCVGPIKYIGKPV